jgi:transcriptional regulator with XRE-family HTH domain
MLGQIETGKSVPTIILLWKIAEALGVPLSVLVTTPGTQTCIVERRAAARVVTVEFTVDNDAPIRLSEGDAITFSSGTAHEIANVGAEASILYLLVAPLRTLRCE